MKRLPLPPRDPGPASPDLWRWIPAVATLRTYQAGWFAKDVFAGIVLTAVLVPTGLSFAQAAGLPGVGGLYASIAALTAYALFGPSRILVLGPDNFSHPVAEYLSAEAAEQAGFVEGRSIIDGIHPDGLTTDGL